jgi:feruloyl esterase
MFPGMAHCGGSAGPDRWDRLAPLVAWVEEGTAPDSVVAHHETAGKVDNERRVCAYPERAVYSGPAGGENERANWVARNFSCGPPR